MCMLHSVAEVKAEFVVCQADRPVLKCVNFIAELSDLHLK